MAVRDDRARARARASRGYHDIRSYPEARHLPGLVIFRFDAPLIFANARTFRDQIRQLAATDPKPRWILIAAEPITDVDTTAADMLFELDRSSTSRAPRWCSPSSRTRCGARSTGTGCTRRSTPHHFFPTVGAAVETFRAKTGSDWVPGDHSRVDQVSDDDHPQELPDP